MSPRLMYTNPAGENPGDLTWKYKDQVLPARQLLYTLRDGYGRPETRSDNWFGDTLRSVSTEANSPVELLMKLCEHVLESGDAMCDDIDEWARKEERAEAANP